MVCAYTDLLHFHMGKVKDLVRALDAGVGVLTKAVQIYGGITTHVEARGVATAQIPETAGASCFSLALFARFGSAGWS